MRKPVVLKAILLLFLFAAGGCGVVSIDMTSSPSSVEPGDPVTFDLKITNRSACPVTPPQVVVQAFISLEQVFSELEAELPADPPPELVEFIEELRTFFEELCAGGNPPPPDPPMFANAACAREGGEVVCRTSGAVPGHSGEGGLSFATLGNRLRCSIDGSLMQCEIRFPVTASADAATIAALPPTLDCASAEFFSGDESSGVCAVGSLNAPLGLGPGEMATGQLVLRARGGGRLRNIAFVIAEDAEDVGVCKGGMNAGQACGFDTACPGSTCGEGICQNGANPGRGCDASTAMMDCGAGGTCVLCAATSGPAFFPLDCTTTQIAVQPAPAVSQWSLAGLALALAIAGTVWVRRRRAA